LCPAYTQLFQAIRDNNQKELRQALEKRLELNVDVEKYGCPLIAAIEAGQLETVKLLAAAGADLNFGYLESPLHAAIRARKRDISEFLLQSECKVACLNKEWETPLYAAIRAQDLNLVRVLVEKGCEINVVNASNMSPLYIAVGLKQGPITKFLLNNGADPNNRGLPCLKLAQELKDTAGINALMGAGAKSQFRRVNASRQQQRVQARSVLARQRPPKPEEGLCSICGGSRDLVKLIPCGHILACKKCVGTFAENHRSCPVCLMGFFATSPCTS
jgi:ankyrin repeat protein